LLSQGFEVYFPFAYGGEVDLLALKDNIIYKIHVKKGTQNNNDKLRADFRRSSKSKNRKYNLGDFDLLAIVHLETKRVAYLTKDDLSAQQSLNMWLTEDIPRKGLSKKYIALKFNDYLNCPIR
jgi:hypothetical protein